MYETYKVAKQFTRESAQKLFLSLKHKDLDMTDYKLESCFSLCMMTVLDEVNNMSKYDHIYFVEFLDMLCRIAIISIKLNDTLEWKV